MAVVAGGTNPGGIGARARRGRLGLVVTLLAGLGFGPGVAAQGASGETPANRLDALGALERLGQNLLGGSDQPEFLHPDAAFVLTAEATDRGAILARWEIAEGYYLYRDRFKFALAEGTGLSLGEPELPRGEIKDDDYFGRMEVYYTEVNARVPVQGAETGGIPVAIDVTYQGCADAGLCYPPSTKRVALTLPAEEPASTIGANPTPGGAGGTGVLAELPEQDRIAHALASTGTFLVLASFFGFGLLLSLTPCVLPMVPILSSIIVGQGSDVGTRRAFGLSLLYVLGMAGTYTAAGVAAGLTGASLQVAFQQPWIIAAFSAVFVLLALSMFGLYELQLPRSWQARLTRLSNRQQGGTYAGVVVMGILSALIVGPCVAAPLAGALIYIGQTGDAVLGGSALFALSMGMGAPLLVIGTSAGRLLPKAGPWMGVVNAVFGVMLLAMAVYLLERVVAEWVALLLWAVLLIVTAIYLGALDSLNARAGGWRRLRKGAGLVMMVYGVLLMVGAATGGGDLLRPLGGLALVGSGERQGLVFKRVKGPEALRYELRAAAARGQAVMLDYYADWCVSCKEMERETFSDPAVQAALSGTVLLQTDVTANDELDQALLRQFGLYGPPAILFFGPDGVERPQYRVVGFVESDDFRELVEKAIAPDSGYRPVRRASVSG